MRELISELREVLYEGRKSPVTAKDWQLYSTMPEAKQAAKDLTAALKEALEALKLQLKTTPAEIRDVSQAISKVFHSILFPVMKKWSNTGATDTEPRYVAGQALVDAAKAHYDWTGYMPGLGDLL